MTTRSDSCSLLEKCVFLLLVIAAAYTVTADQECDPSKCPGPLRYYKSLGCKPVYKNEGDCCAIRYDCDHLKTRSKDKCYVNGHEYSIGETLKDEHKNPCDIGCMCRKGYGGIASFVCAIVDCFDRPAEEPNCYHKNSPNQCCQGEKVCVDNIEDRPKCMTEDGLFYDGESFKPSSDPELNCVCQPGYNGQNVEPFCKKPNHPYCNPEFTRPYELHKNCAPVFYSSQAPQTGCHLSTRCQNSNDTVIHNHEEIKLKSNEEEDETMMCKFGDLRMHLGDELNQNTDYTSICVKCLCEIPPVPTCQQLPDNQCNRTVRID